MILVDLPSEAIMLIARFTPHPCAEIMQGCYCGEKWFDWLERFEHRRQQIFSPSRRSMRGRRSARRSGLISILWRC